MKKIYYAHPISTYGSIIETKDIETLSNLGLSVLNPNNAEIQEEYQEIKKKDGENPMNLFKNLINQCDCFCFRGLPDSSIPSGIAFELEYAKELGLPIIELPCSLYKRVINHSQTKEYLTEIGYYK